MDSIIIRPLVATDGPAAGEVFFDAVQRGTMAEYTQEQRDAWAGAVHDPEGWTDRLDGVDGFAAEADGRVVGFMTIDADGHVDLAFIRSDAIGQGVGRQLYDAVEDRAKALGATVMTTDASLKARPFFERMGWHVVREQKPVRRGVELTNFRMEKVLTA
ncbi:GNAT family N-acetyltransferase [Chachezhania antarctica]|uniref:GNAT family N-acetyltransferase n=1 Tax=Chachezhania antarctica TaxID=2340860 RepID=UPI000EB58960|nr:GNAT family N-acetyltransferase [Chachezhania antarctica]|tara:strand:- start:754 stop:1230 length:477 start_codon:yes stop_codon:yes gene_type:complete